MSDLPMHLQQLEALPSALDILRYLAQQVDTAASPEDVCDALGISDRRFNKALRRLVTNNYMNMRADFLYELTRKGKSSAQELAEYDAAGPRNTGLRAGQVSRDVVIAIPRQLVSGQTTEVLFGIEPHLGDGFRNTTDVVLRFDAVNASINTRDKMVQLGASAYRSSFSVTPGKYDQVRFKVQVFQLSEDGEDLSDCGGMYVDVHVIEGATNEALIAYSTSVTLRDR